MSEEDVYENHLHPAVKNFWNGLANDDVEQCTDALDSLGEHGLAVEAVDETEGTSLKSHQLPRGTAPLLLQVYNEGTPVKLVEISVTTCGRLVGRATQSRYGSGRFCYVSDCLKVSHLKGEKAEVQPGELAIRLPETSTSRSVALYEPILDPSDLPFPLELKRSAVRLLLTLEAVPKAWKLVIDLMPSWKESLRGGGQVELEEGLSRFVAEQEMAAEEEKQPDGPWLNSDSDSEEEKDEEASNLRDQEDEEEDSEASFTIRDIQGEVDQIRAIIDVCLDNNESFQEQFEEIEARLNQLVYRHQEAVKRLHDEVKALKRTVKAMKAGASVSTGGGHIDVNRVQTLVANQVAREGLIKSSDLPADFVDMFKKVCEAVLSPSGSLSTLTDRVDVMGSRTAGAVELGGHIFKSATDVQIFFGNDPNILRYVGDMKNLMLLSHTPYMDSAGGIAATANAVKGGFSSLTEGIVETGFALAYPESLLRISAKESDQKDNGVIFAPGLASYALWAGNHMSSTKARICDSVAQVKAKLLNLINYQYPVKSGARAAKVNAVLVCLVNEGYGHCIGLLDNMEPLYKTLTQGGMSDKEAWRRVKLFVKGVFDSIQQVRGMSSEGTPDMMLWACMQAHQVAKEYHLQKWIKHPNVSSILALSALEHEGDAIAALEVTINSFPGK